MTPLIAWIALALSIATTIFWAGVYFGTLRGRMDRMRVRIRDLEKAYEQLGERKFKPRITEKDER